jgi:hypothetical protein
MGIGRWNFRGSLMPRKPKPPAAEPPDVGGLTDPQREALSNWMREKITDMENYHAQREEILRTVGEHPSPLMGKFIRTFAGLHMPMKYIASLCSTTPNTIEKYYQEELTLGRAEVVAMVATNAVRIATSVTDPSASKVALSILDRMGGDDWKPPTKRVEMGEIEKPRVLDTSKLTYEQRAQLREIMLSMAGQAPAALGQDETEVSDE